MSSLDSDKTLKKEEEDSGWLFDTIPLAKGMVEPP